MFRFVGLVLDTGLGAGYYSEENVCVIMTQTLFDIVLTCAPAGILP